MTARTYGVDRRARQNDGPSRKRGRPIAPLAALILLVAGACCDRREESRPRAAPPLVNSTKVFCVDLQDGFTGAKVIVSVDNRAVYRGTPTTNPVLGFADSFSAEAGANPSTLRVQCPSQSVDISKQIDLRKGKTIGISLASGQLRLLQQDHGFGYD